ncbi:hypothetical protein JD844_021831 [Phrynosoma platyrhinos]|uniref:Uncharacterized protein n=1 Tax=Phrynosoma platyrhinos TaxID=52577 RepID=A0ABQ7SU20_PHRPL|nr:hypothetical protein JD844_021831 [Phrynosoma platyrhinos]
MWHKNLDDTPRCLGSTRGEVVAAVYKLQGAAEDAAPFLEFPTETLRTVNSLGTKPAVIIIQNRLTQQHLRMFNREVKSADVEQLLSPIAESEVMMEVTPVCRDNHMEKLEKEQVHEAAVHKSVPTEQSGCTGKALGGGNNENSLHVILVSVTEPHRITAVEAAEAESQPLVAPSVLEFSPQVTETGTF